MNIHRRVTTTPEKNPVLNSMWPFTNSTPDFKLGFFDG
jgi:hypothetical protein